MSIRNVQQSNLNQRHLNAPRPIVRPIPTRVNAELWIRNPSWPACEANTGDNKVVGLYAVYPGDGVGNGGNFFAMTNAGDYTIDYGDGTVTNYSSGSTAYYEFDYNNASLANTDAPVTFTASTSTVNRDAHGYNNGDAVQFYNIANTTGIIETQTYYVTNATSNTFQISATNQDAFSVGTQDTSPTDLFFSPDGTKMYMVGGALTRINKYDLNNPWDVSSASYNQFFSVSAQDTGPQGLFFKPDGTKMYVLGDTGNDVNEYDLSTAWDISTASYLQNFSVATEETVPTGLFFKSDGTKMYISGSNGDEVNEYDLSTAWDISTASYVQVFSVATEENSPQGLFFKPDGTKMYVLGYAGNDVNEYDLSTAWDISTASYLQNFSVATEETVPTGLFFKPDGTRMYVVGQTSDTVYTYFLSTPWDVSTASYGLDSIVEFTNDGSATLLPYKIATVTITPQAGNNLTTINFFVKHNQTGLQAYSTGWLDIAIAAPNCTNLTIGSNNMILFHYNLERVRLNQLGSITSFVNLFYFLYSLSNVVISNTITTVTNMGSMFRNCYSLKTVPLFDTSKVTDMSNMFNTCYSLTSVPLFNTSKVINMTYMFYGCNSLTTVPPLFDTSNVTNMSAMFQGCYSLVSVPLFNTSKVTTMTNMFSSCASLTSVPLFNTSIVTAMSSMFNGCNSLVSVPLFDTSSLTSMGNMFVSCYSLTTVPLFNTSKVTDMSAMFNGCNSLTTVPLFDTRNVTNMSSMFTNCWSLKTVPLFNTRKVTNMGNMFFNCYSLVSVPLFNTSSVTSMTSIFNSCYSLKKVLLFNTYKVTNMSSMFQNCFSLTTVPALITTAVTAASGFTNMFSNCNNITRIQAKNFRFTFSVSGCKLSSDALNEIYTNLPTVTSQTITVTNNYGTAGDDPTIATAKGWTVTG